MGGVFKIGKSNYSLPGASMCVVWWASKINARACILDTQSFERVAASKKPRVRSIAVRADAMGMEIVNLGLKGIILRHFLT
jgi:hypothetical protein